MKTHFQRSMKIVSAIFFTLSFCLTADAQRIQSNVLELQNRIEAQIDRNVSNLISTQLAPETFEVSTRVKVVEAPSAPPKPNNKTEIESMPAGMELGSVDVREVLDSYRKQIDEMKAFKQTAQAPPEEMKYAVTRIEVVVGLADTYDNAYIEQFQEWLKKRVKLDYGPSAIASVSKTKPVPLKEPVSPNWRDFLPLFYYALLAAALVAAAWLLARGLIRLGEGAKTIVVEHKNVFEHNQRIEQKAEEKIENEIEDGISGAAAQLEKKKPEDKDLELLQAGDELIGKIAFLCLEMGKGVNDLVRFWLDNGNEGFVKTAVLVDLIVTLKEKVSSETEAANIAFKLKYSAETAAAIASLKIPLDSDLASSYGVNLSEAYREAATMTLDVKLKHLESVYWDLLQIRTIGLPNMRKPFDFLQSMNDASFAEAIKSQPDESKALALMFGDAQKTKNFLASVDNFEKEKIVTNMMNLTHVSKKHISDVDSAMKLRLLNSSMNPSESLVNLVPRTLSMLNTLSPIDEIRVLRKSVSALPDRGVSIKEQFVTLAFVDEWHDEYVSRLVKISTTMEIVQLIHAIPESETIVLSVCPDKMKMIVTDDLQMSAPNESTMEKGITALKQKWKKICAQDNLSMSNVVNFDKKVELKNVA